MGSRRREAHRRLPPRPPPRPQRVDALKEATRLFASGERVDMQVIAATLGVDRVTLYRWVGSRESLLLELLWYRLDRTIARKLARIPAGRPVSATVIAATTRAVMSNAGMQAFLEREGELALRLLTTRASPFQRRLIARLGALVDRDRRAGLLRSPVPFADLPYVLVRIMESYVYLGLITGDAPDTRRASRVIAALLP